MFLYLYPSHNPKFNSQIQKVFKQLNDWTMGNIWDNFVIVFGRTTFNPYDVDTRYEEDISQIGYKRELVEGYKNILSKIAQSEGWMRTLNNGEERKMSPADFSSIRFSI